MSAELARVAESKRHFVSTAVEQAIKTASAHIDDPELVTLFANCLPNTLDTTVYPGRDAKGRPDTHVITGDIDAMWLRDSTAQVWPYLRLISKDAALSRTDRRRDSSAIGMREG